MATSSLGIGLRRPTNVARVRQALSERSVAPARIMVPRVVFAVVSLALVLFGLLMIYSSSSIMGLTSEVYDHDPTYFLVRQAAFAGIGIVLAIVVALFDYRRIRGPLLYTTLFATVTLLLVVLTTAAGRGAYGATRWIAIGPFTLQPSEFAKVVILLVGANVIVRVMHDGTLYGKRAIAIIAGGILLPLALIFIQPDKGTTGVVFLSLLVMLYLAGIPGIWIAGFAAVMLAGVLGVAFFGGGYAKARIETVLDPFADEYGSGYQIAQGIYALGSGGFGGVGLGLSRQKYNYLPMAHNDFIFAIVGEELGFVGAVGLLLAFVVLLWAGLKIAEQAEDMLGKLIAAGCTTMIFVQLMLNVCGVIAIFPLSGKPVPFVSYGGSSVISSLLLVGLVMSVSMHTTLPETSHELRRSRMRVADGTRQERSRDVSGVSPRRTADVLVARSSMSARPTSDTFSSRTQANAYQPARSGLRLVQGGASRSSAARGRVTTDANGRRRLDLGPTPAERLRSSRETTRRR